MRELFCDADNHVLHWEFPPCRRTIFYIEPDRIGTRLIDFPYLNFVMVISRLHDLQNICGLYLGIRKNPIADNHDSLFMPPLPNCYRNLKVCMPGVNLLESVDKEYLFKKAVNCFWQSAFTGFPVNSYPMDKPLDFKQAWFFGTCLKDFKHCRKRMFRYQGRLYELNCSGAGCVYFTFENTQTIYHIHTSNGELYPPVASIITRAEVERLNAPLEIGTAVCVK